MSSGAVRPPNAKHLLFPPQRLLRRPGDAINAILAGRRHEPQIEQQNYHLLAGPLEPLRRTGIGSFMQIECGGRKNPAE